MQDGTNICRLYLIKPSAKDSFHFGGKCAAKEKPKHLTTPLKNERNMYKGNRLTPYWPN